MQHMRLGYALCVVTFLLIGCAATKFGTAETTYKASNFGTTELEEHGLAVLPVVAGDGVEGYRRPFGESINSAITQGNVLTWQETMEALNNGGLVTAYNDAVIAY